MLSGLFRTQYLAVAGLSPREYNGGIMKNKQKKRLTLAEKQMAAALDITEIHFDDEGRAVLRFQGKPKAAAEATVRHIEIEANPGRRKPWPGSNLDILNETEPE
jgi:hypothetical protein